VTESSSKKTCLSSGMRDFLILKSVIRVREKMHVIVNCCRMKKVKSNKLLSPLFVLCPKVFINLDHFSSP